MPSLRQVAFDGMKPAVDTLNSRSTQAQLAKNMSLRTSTIRPIRSPRTRESLRHFGDPDHKRGLHLLTDTDECCGGVVTFDKDASVVTVPDPSHCAGFEGVVVFPCNCDDPYRYFKCEDHDGDSGVYPLVVPQPQRTLSVALTGQGTQVQNPQCYNYGDDRSYTYTWVDRFGVESPPAIPSRTLTAFDDQTFTLTNFDDPPANAVCLRVYRTTPSFEGNGADTPQFDTDFHLVAEVDLTDGVFSGTFVDDIPTERMAFGSLLTDTDCPPPCMDQVVLTESGHAVGFRNNQLYVSERHEMHNWPEKFRVELPHRIVGIVAFYDWVFVGTSGPPYRIQVQPTNGGNEADTLVEPLPYAEHFPCLSRYAMVATNFGAMYPSKRGMVALAPSGSAALVSRDRVDEEDWEFDWAPNLGAWHDGKYYGVRAPSGQAFVMDIVDNADGPLDIGDLILLDLQAVAMHAGEDGRLYYIAPEGDLLSWGDGDTYMRWTYVSRVFRHNGMVGFNTAKVVGRYGSGVTLTVYCDGTEYDKLDFASVNPCRLARGGFGLNWSFKLEGSIPVSEVHIATSAQELAEATGG